MAYRTSGGGLDGRLMLHARGLQGELRKPVLRAGGGQDSPAGNMAKVYNFPQRQQGQANGGQRVPNGQPTNARPASAQKPAQRQPNQKEELRRKVYSMVLRDKRLYREGKPDMDVLETLTDIVTLDAERELAKKDGRQLGDIVRDIVERFLGNR